MQADEIRADYSELGQLAGRFATQSQSTAELMQKVRATMEKLEDGWMGQGADAFFAEMHSVALPAVQRLQQALDDASQTTNEIAQLLQQAEEEASGPFRNR